MYNSEILSMTLFNLLGLGICFASRKPASVASLGRSPALQGVTLKQSPEQSLSNIGCGHPPKQNQTKVFKLTQLYILTMLYTQYNFLLNFSCLIKSNILVGQPFSADFFLGTIENVTEKEKLHTISNAKIPLHKITHIT